MNTNIEYKYIGNRYVPLPLGEHNPNLEYESLSVVLDIQTGDSYTSKQNVPIGIPLNDTNYWVLSSKFDAQIDALKTGKINYSDIVNNLDDGGIKKVLSAEQGKLIGSNITSIKKQLVINVKDFGAKGDGVNDDTQSIQDAINFAFKKVISSQSSIIGISPSRYINNLTVLLPEGNYKISKTINCYTGVILKGNGVNCTFISVDNTLITKIESVISLCNIPNGDTPTTIEDVEYGKLLSFTILGNNKSKLAITNAISGNSLSSYVIEDVMTQKTDCGVLIRGCWNSTFRRVTVQECIVGVIFDRNAVNLTNVNTNIFEKIIILSCNRVGFWHRGQGSIIEAINIEAIGKQAWGGGFDTSISFSYGGRNYTKGKDNVEFNHPIGMYFTERTHSVKIIEPWFERIQSINGDGTCIEFRDEDFWESGNTLMVGNIINGGLYNNDCDLAFYIRAGRIEIINPNIVSTKKIKVNFNEGKANVTLRSWVYNIFLSKTGEVELIGTANTRLNVVDSVSNDDQTSKLSASLLKPNQAYDREVLILNTTTDTETFAFNSNLNSSSKRKDISLDYRVNNVSQLIKIIESIDLPTGVKCLNSNVGKFSISNGTTIRVVHTHHFADAVVVLCPLNAYSATLMNKHYFSSINWNQFDVNFTETITELAEFKYIIMPSTTAL